MENETVEILRITRDDQGLNVTMSISPESAPQAMKVLAASAELFGDATSIADTANRKKSENEACADPYRVTDAYGQTLQLPASYQADPLLREILQGAGYNVEYVRNIYHARFSSWLQ